MRILCLYCNPFKVRTCSHISGSLQTVILGFIFFFFEYKSTLNVQNSKAYSEHHYVIISPLKCKHAEKFHIILGQALTQAFLIFPDSTVLALKAVKHVTAFKLGRFYKGRIEREIMYSFHSLFILKCYYCQCELCVI